MKLNRAGVAVGVLVAATALAACGSSGGSANQTGSSSSGASSASESTGAGGGAAPASFTCSTGRLNAEGSTAQTNAINEWIKDYQSKCTGATVNYTPTGSGDGVSKFIADQVDSAGSDSALDATSGEVKAAAARCGSTPLDLPMVVGPIAVAYNLKSLQKPIVLAGKTIAGIFLGKIRTWNDPAIEALNHGANLPSTKITVFYRSDSSGTTQNFEKYLGARRPPSSPPSRTRTRARPVSPVRARQSPRVSPTPSAAPTGRSVTRSSPSR